MSSDTVQRLRVRGPAGVDALRLRQRAEAALASGLAAPTGLPPGALLCVRHLALRLPSVAQAALAPLAGPRLRAPLEAAWAQAVRPRDGSPGAAAPALWFEDEAELLAFLARRAGAGDTAAWWWPALAGRAVPPWAAVAAAWAIRPQAVPAAVAQLGAAAEPLCAAMGDEACARVAEAVARVWGAPASAWRPQRPPDAVPVARPGAAPAQVRALAVTTGGAVAGVGEPPRVFAGAQPVTVMAAAAVSDGAGLAPVAAGGTATAARRLVALARALHERPWAAASPDLLAEVDRDAPRQRPAEAAPSPPGSPPRPRAQAPAGSSRGRSGPKPALPAGTPPLGPAAAQPPGPAITASRVGGPPRGAAPAAAAQVPACAPGPAPVLHTAYAGLFFVLPLLQRRGLLGDFTRPQAPAGALHPAWWLLALLRRHARPGDADAEPLARLLRGWAGGPRPRLAVSWRHHVAELHRALQADAAQALQRPARGTMAWLVRRPGRLRLSATRLDLHLDLATHPLAIRAAGLDRDPGWIPAAGRHVAFHFELP